MNSSFSQLESQLWSAADNLRANSDLKSQDYSTPVLGLIFLKYADVRFSNAKEETDCKGKRRTQLKGWIIQFLLEGAPY